MDIRRKVRKIALVLATLALVPSLILGWNAYKDARTVPIYAKPTQPTDPRYRPDEDPVQRVIRLMREQGGYITHYEYPPDWQCAIAGLVATGIVFPLVLFGTRGATHLVLRLTAGKPHKVTMLLGITIIVLMGLYPPWIYYTPSHPLGAPIETPAGYAFIFNPPSPERAGRMHGVSLDIKRLLVQWSFVGIVTAGLAYILRRREQDHPIDVSQAPKNPQSSNAP